VARALEGRHVLYVPSRFGNAGDRLIAAGTYQFFADAGVHVVSPQAGPPSRARGCGPRPLAVVMAGGGNFGDLWPRNDADRAACVADADRMGLPSLVLPQSACGRSKTPTAAFVFAREAPSLDLLRAAGYASELAPDMALYADPDLILGGPAPAPAERVGVLLRRDHESHGLAGTERGGGGGGFDPADPRRAATAAHYLLLAARYERIVTDRLHFAVAGLMLGRHVTLRPNCYHKNRGMYDAWLRGLGCAWEDASA
jgi:exopolysaccharide biosynthesis predicted pyruvyltransferase EpsI